MELLRLSGGSIRPTYNKQAAHAMRSAKGTGPQMSTYPDMLNERWEIFGSSRASVAHTRSKPYPFAREKSLDSRGSVCSKAQACCLVLLSGRRMCFLVGDVPTFATVGSVTIIPLFGNRSSAPQTCGEEFKRLLYDSSICWAYAPFY